MVLVKIFLIGSGGFIGSVLRYLISSAIQHATNSITFPYGTLAVNLIGCFLVGFLSYFSDVRGIFSGEVRAFIFVGILGGFTTFSAFGNETMNLFRDNENTLALINIVGHILLGLTAIWIGRNLAYLLWK